MALKCSTRRGSTHCTSCAAEFAFRFRQDPLGEKRGEAFLNLIRESEVESPLFAGVQIAQDRDRLARIVIAVVIEEDNLAADLFL